MKILFTILVSISFSSSIVEPDFIQKKGKNIELVFTNEIPKIDGILDTKIWDKAKISSDFLQEDPYNLSLPSNETRVRVLYDSENLYIFAEMFIDDPNEISAKLVNRDNWEDGFDGFSDYFSFDIDSRHDHQTGFIFSVNAAGVQADAVVFDDSGYDPEWNAVWESNVAVFNDCWTVEMKIPFSILRFSKSDNMKWGLNMYRYIHSKNEYIAWVAYPYDIPGISSKYGHLSGFDKTLSTKRFEFLPHLINGRTVYYDVNLEDPEKMPLSHKEILDLDVRTNYGFDIKYGLGSNASLDLTYYPDYGQIEADPAEINLTYYQTRFIEKRPFFLENSSIFDTPIEVFYTRRIGGNYDKINHAEKITGKTINNITYGFIHASTNMDTSINNQQVKFENNYFVSRLTKDLLKGNSYIGMMTSHLFDSSDVVSFDAVFNLLDNRISTNGQLVFSKENEKLGKGFFYEFKYLAPKLISLWFEIDYYDKDFDINKVGYLRRNNFRPCPKNIDAGVQGLPNFLKIPFPSQSRPPHAAAVRRRTKEKSGTGSCSPGEVSIKMIGRMTLSQCKCSEASTVLGSHRVRDVIKQDGEITDAQLIQLLQTALQCFKFGCLSIGHIQTRTDGKHKSHTMCMTIVDQELQF